jgi:putative addiction module component (TIGR02574 family)
MKIAIHALLLSCRQIDSGVGDIYRLRIHPMVEAKDMDTNSSGTDDFNRDGGKGGLNGSILNGLDTVRESVMDKKLTDLPIDERIKLVEDLWDSIASDQNALPVTPEQKVELDRRLEAYAIDKNPGRSASEVIDDIRRRI